VVVAPDKFKGSLSALQVATLVRTGIQQVMPEADVRLAPVADGGEGTVEAALVAGYRPLEVAVTGPLGQPVNAVMAVRDTVAVVELAQASGLQHNVGLPQPLAASSTGTGELIRAALDAGCRTVILGVGGSASTDGGAGMVQALGARLTDAAGRTLDPGGGPLEALHQLDLTRLDPRIAATTFVLASDVDNPLLGKHGAAAVFGPQKGATPAQVALLEASLQRWALVVSDAVGQDLSARAGAGAAGGVGFAAIALLGATAQPGIELMLSMLGFSELLPGACLVVTGEGSLDEQSLHGKAPVGVAQAATRHGIATVAVAGRTTLSPDVLAAAGFSATHTLQALEPDLNRCMAEAAPLVVSIGRQIATESLLPLSRTVS
jgi:glycerate kinase